MRIIGRDRLDAFCARHADARTWIEAWLHEVETTSWAVPQDIRDRYASASFLADNIVIFNVKGNKYRLETLVAYNARTIVIRKVETHAEYSKANKRKK